MPNFVSRYLPVTSYDLRPGDTILVPAAPGFQTATVERIELGREVYVHGSETPIRFEIGMNFGVAYRLARLGD